MILSEIGIEKDLTYCCLAEKRLEIAEKDKSIQGYEDGVFWERNSLALQKKNGKNGSGKRTKTFEIQQDLLF